VETNNFALLKLHLTKPPVKHANTLEAKLVKQQHCSRILNQWCMVREVDTDTTQRGWKALAEALEAAMRPEPDNPLFREQISPKYVKDCCGVQFEHYIIIVPILGSLVGNR
jgi:hypothetical protein